MGKKKNRNPYQTDRDSQMKAMSVLDSLVKGINVDVTNVVEEPEVDYTEDDDIFRNSIQDIMNERRQERREKKSEKPKLDAPKTNKQVTKAPVKEAKPVVSNNTDRNDYGINISHINCGVTSLLIISDPIRQITIDLDSVCNATKPCDSDEVEELADSFLKYILPTLMPQMISSFAYIDSQKFDKDTYPDELFHFYSSGDTILGYYINVPSLKAFRELCETYNEQGLLVDLFVKISSMLMSDGFNNATIRGNRMTMYTEISTWMDYQQTFENKFRAMLSSETDRTMTIHEIIDDNDSILPIEYYEGIETFIRSLCDAEDYAISEEEDDEDEISEEELEDVEDIDTFTQTLNESETVTSSDNGGLVMNAKNVTEEPKSTDATPTGKSPIVSHMEAMQEAALQMAETTSETEEDDFSDLMDDVEESETGVVEEKTETPNVIKPVQSNDDDEFVVKRRF